jgi:hypothetical protein
MTESPRIALIHALAHSVAPVNEAFDRLWPGCVRMNLLDDSLSSDLASGRAIVDNGMTSRFVALATYAVRTGASGILFTCSAFGPCIQEVAHRFPTIPVLKPNEAMIADAVQTGQTIGLIASFAGTLATMPQEFPAGTAAVPVLAEGALEALNAGDPARHDALVVDAAQRAAVLGCGVIALAQFSLARAAPAVAAATALPVLTTVESAVRLLRQRVESA